MSFCFPSLFKKFKFKKKEREIASLNYHCASHNFHSLLTLFSSTTAPTKQRSPKFFQNLFQIRSLPATTAWQNFTLSQGHVGSGTTLRLPASQAGEGWAGRWGAKQRLWSGGRGAWGQAWPVVRHKPLGASQPPGTVWETRAGRQTAGKPRNPQQRRGWKLYGRWQRRGFGGGSAGGGGKGTKSRKSPSGTAHRNRSPAARSRTLERKTQPASKVQEVLV